MVTTSLRIHTKSMRNVVSLNEKRGFFEIDMKYIKESFVEDIKADMALLLEIQKKWFGEDGTIMSDPKLESFKGILDKQIAKEPQRGPPAKNHCVY